ncbi:hypothetical protein EDC18_103281 [Natranaerovirga pectinivora]|uniref:Uncharacterized protein n=1 Tax=Natranaerovirga pectinivora TaxID=682400 RepID=A0A4R3MMT5_9FIRM|nr:hypothetical protein [Natranaerovirga pectinivora]TCT15575.1 hypothetical protein EDC18_103281 [Natranaerovirga pectinivora]
MTHIIMAIIPVVILVILNLQAKKPIYIVTLTVFQVIYSISIFMYLIFKLGVIILDVMFKTQLSKNYTFFDPSAERKKKLQQREEQLATADFNARRLGFDDAEEAENLGVWTGTRKPD